MKALINGKFLVKYDRPIRLPQKLNEKLHNYLDTIDTGSSVASRGISTQNLNTYQLKMLTSLRSHLPTSISVSLQIINKKINKLLLSLQSFACHHIWMPTFYLFMQQIFMKLHGAPCTIPSVNNRQKSLIQGIFSVWWVWKVSH